MVKPMKYRELAKLLRAAGFTQAQGKGSHEKWTAPSGNHVTIKHDTEISPGVVAQALKAIEREESK